jgi:hypothetical protein
LKRVSKVTASDPKLDSIEAKDVVAAPSQADDLTQDEELAAVPEAHRVAIAGMKQDMDERKVYARRIFILICCWVGGMFVLLLAQGLGTWYWLRFALPTSIMLAAVGSTTVNVLGLLYIVVHYLFPDTGRKSGPNSRGKR